MVCNKTRTLWNWLHLSLSASSSSSSSGDHVTAVHTAQILHSLLLANQDSSPHPLHAPLGSHKTHQPALCSLHATLLKHTAATAPIVLSRRSMFAAWWESASLAEVLTKFDVMWKREQSEPACDVSAPAKTKLKPQPKTHFHHSDLDNTDFLRNRAHVHHREKLPEQNKKTQHSSI